SATSGAAIRARSIRAARASRSTRPAGSSERSRLARGGLGLERQRLFARIAPAGALAAPARLLALECEQLLELAPALLGRGDEQRFVLAVRRHRPQLLDVVAPEAHRERARVVRLP